MADKKITQMTAADVADLGALTSFFEVTVDALVTPLTRKIGLGKIATWLATIGLAASNVLAQGVTVTQGTITDPVAGYVQSVTWNDVADTFIAQTLDVTDTASAAGSLLARWRVGGADKFVVSKAGAVTAGAASFTTLAASGLITSTLGNDQAIFNSASATTGYQYLAITNTSGSAIFGVQGASTALGGTNSANYDTIVRGQAGISFSADAGTSTTARITATSLIVGASTFVVTAATGNTSVGIADGAHAGLLVINGGTAANLTSVLDLNRAGAKEWVFAVGGTNTSDLTIGNTPAGYSDANIAALTGKIVVTAAGAITTSSSLAITGALTGVTSILATTGGYFGASATVESGIALLGRSAGDTDATRAIQLRNNTGTDLFNVKGDGTVNIAGKTLIFGANDSAGAGYRTVTIQNA